MAVQTLLAREIADTSRPQAVRKLSVSHLIKSSILLGGSVASALSISTYLQRSNILSGLTSSPAIKEVSLAIFPAVLATQGEFKIHTSKRI